MSSKSGQQRKQGQSKTGRLVIRRDRYRIQTKKKSEKGQTEMGRNTYVRKGVGSPVNLRENNKGKKAREKGEKGSEVAD